SMVMHVKLAKTFFLSRYGPSGPCYCEYQLLLQYITVAIQLVAFHDSAKMLDWRDILLYIVLISFSLFVYPILLFHTNKLYSIHIYTIVSLFMDCFYLFANLHNNATQLNQGDLSIPQAIAITYSGIHSAVRLHFYQQTPFTSLLKILKIHTMTANNNFSN